MSTKVYFLNSEDASYNDEEFAWFETLMLNEGIIATEQNGELGFEVTEREEGGANMSVDVHTGKAIINLKPDTRNLNVIVELTELQNLTVSGNSTGDVRVDSVIIRADDSVEPNETKSNVATVEVIEGTGTDALSDSDIDTIVEGDKWQRIADINVPDGAVEITDSDIIDKRQKIEITESLASAIKRAYTENITDISGQLDASEQSTPSMSVDLNNGHYYIGGERYEYAGGSVEFTEPSADERIDLIVFNSSGEAEIVEGEESATPSAPAFPAGKALGHQIHLRAGMTSIKDEDDGSNGYIEKDLREFVKTPKAPKAPNIRVFTSDTTYTPASDVVGVIVEVIGGGGGGRHGKENPTSGNRETGAGGGGGGYARKSYSAADLESGVSITIGSGGSGEDFFDGGVSAGGTTSFGSLQATGGGTGDGMKIGGAGGAGSGGDVSGDGGDGDNGSYEHGGGRGGNSIYGKGGKSVSGEDSDGNSGSFPGGGGSGGCDDSGDGGNGAKGAVIITEYFE